MSQQKKLIRSPIGPLELIFEELQLVSLTILIDPPRAPLDHMVEFDHYFQGKSTSINVPFTSRGTPFQKRVWEAILRIPYGQTWSYSKLAEVVNSGPRAVANACGKNPLPLLIPCHRVLRLDGSLGGYSGGRGLTTKKHLLTLEGAL